MTVAVVQGAEAFTATGAGARASVGVVVVHGFTGNPNSTRPLGERLHAAGYTVEVPRLPGHGTRVADMARTRYADWRAEVERVVDDLRQRCETVVLGGLSMGGTISLDVAARRPTQVDAVFTINAPILERPGVLARLGPLLQHVLPPLPRELADLPADDIARPNVSERGYRFVPARSGVSFTSELRRIRSGLLDVTQPLLVAWSPQDNSVLPENADAILERVASTHVTEVVCDRSYHVATLDWDRDRLEAAILRWLEDVTGR